MIFDRQVNRVHILDFERLTPDMRQDLAERLRMVYTRDDGQEVFMSHAWRRLFEIQALLVHEFILEFFSTCRIGSEMGLDVTGLHTTEDMAEDEFGAYWFKVSSGRDFLRGAPSYTYIRDSVRRLYHRLISYNISGWGQVPKKVTATDLFYLRNMDEGVANVLYLLAQYLFRHVEGRKSSARLSGGHFIGRLAHHFGLVSDDGLRGLSVVTREIPLVDMGRIEINGLVAPRPERKPDVAAGALKAAEDAPIADEGTLAVPAPVQAPQPPPPPPTAGRTMPQRLGRLKEKMEGLRQDVRSLRGLVERSMTDQDRFSTWMISCMTQLMETSGLTYQAFDGTFQGSYPAVFERRTRRKTDSANTSAAPHQPDL
ncbi:hypothetical protein Tco_0371196 [Tanacetum coccineum]